MTAGEYARLGREVLADLKARGRLPVMVGGTGLYLRALLQGLFPGPQRSEELRLRLRASASKKGPAHLHRVLAQMDRAAAGKIHPNDEPKLIPAIEVCLAAQTPMTELWEQGREPLRGFRILRVGLDPERQQLYARINQRAAKMFESGLVEETEGLLRKYPKSPVLASLGYKQAAQLLRGEVTRDRAITAAQQGHRNYAKRQMTWFRREPEVEWVKGFGDENAVVEQVVSLVERRLQSAD